MIPCEDISYMASGPTSYDKELTRIFRERCVDSQG